MRKPHTILFALCGTLLILLVLGGGRLLYINLHDQSFEDIAGSGAQLSLRLTENQIDIKTLTDEASIEPFVTLLSSYTYTEYPSLLPPSTDALTANRLTVIFENGASISVDADGNVFVNDKLRAIEEGSSKTLYHDLYALVYPNAA